MKRMAEQRPEHEVQAAQRVGLPASYTEETDLPYPVAGAIRFDDQAELDSRAYVLGLTRLLGHEGPAGGEDRVVDELRVAGRFEVCRAYVEGTERHSAVEVGKELDRRRGSAEERGSRGPGDLDVE